MDPSPAAAPPESPWRPTVGPKTWFVLYLGVLLVLAAMVQGSFELGSDGYARARLSDQIQSRAWRPFVYRALVPLTVRLLKAPIPDPTLASIQTWATVQTHTNAPFLDLLLTRTIWYASFVLFALAFVYLAKALYDAKAAHIYGLSLIALGGLPMFFACNYIYDPTQVLLFTLGLALMARRRWWLYLVVFALGCINKETTVLLAAIYFLTLRGSEPKPRFHRMLVAQALLFVAIKGAVSLLFRDRLGSPVEFQLDHNLALGARPLPLVVSYLAIATAVAHDWARKPLLLRWSLAMLLPLMGLTLFLGYLDEYRDYYEVYPAALLLVSQTLAKVVGIELRPREPAVG